MIILSFLRMEGRTDGPTNGQSDILSYRDAWPHLKRVTDPRTDQWTDRQTHPLIDRYV